MITKTGKNYRRTQTDVYRSRLTEMQQNNEAYDEPGGQEGPLVLIPPPSGHGVGQYDGIVKEGTGAVAQHRTYLFAMTSEDPDVRRQRHHHRWEKFDSVTPNYKYRSLRN